MLPDFHHGNLASILKLASKALIETTPFLKPNLKVYSFKALKANTNCLFSTANVRKLRFYQNKGLSLDRCCGMPKTFSKRNQNSELKNQDFLPIRIRLGKTTLFLSLGLVIKSNRFI